MGSALKVLLAEQCLDSAYQDAEHGKAENPVLNPSSREMNNCDVLDGRGLLFWLSRDGLVGDGGLDRFKLWDGRR